jgi:hypothetical protein
MANVLTGLIPVIHEAMDQVAHEQVGFIPSCFKNAGAARAALNETIRYAIAPTDDLEDTTAAAAPADTGDVTVGYADMTISKSKAFPIRLTGEEEKGLANAGIADSIMRDRFAQAFRKLDNAVEADLAALYPYCSRAVKTTGLHLFDSTDRLASLAQLRRIIIDNGGMGQELRLVLGSSAGALLRSNDNLFKVNEAGTDAMLRQGVIGNLMGFGVGESAQITAHTNGDYTDSVVTDLDLDGTAITGTSLAGNLKGDLLKIATDDDNVYVLNANATATAGVINAPGSKVAHSGATDAVTPLIATSYIPNMAFARNAIHLVTRLPAAPSLGDAAIDMYTITSPITGIAYEVRVYAQYRRIKIEVALAWGCKMVKPEFAAILAE